MQSIFNIELDTSEYNVLAVNDTILYVSNSSCGSDIIYT